MKKLAAVFVLVMFASLFVGAVAFAADGGTTSAVDWVGNLSTLYGPLCGLLVAIVVVCERIAKVIPNSTNSRILKVLLAITTVIGVKVPDNQ